MDEIKTADCENGKCSSCGELFYFPMMNSVDGVLLCNECYKDIKEESK